MLHEQPDDLSNMDQIKQFSAELDERTNLSPVQKAYVDQIGTIGATFKREAEERQSHRGLLMVDEKPVKIEDYLEEHEKNINDLDFKYTYNIDSIDLFLENKIEPANIFSKLSECWGEHRTLERIMLLPKAARDKMYVSATNGSNERLTKTAIELGKYFKREAYNTTLWSAKFVSLIKFMGLPLNNIDRRNIAPDIMKTAPEARDNFKEQLSGNQTYDLDLVSLCQDPTGLFSMFRSAEIEYIDRKDAINFVKVTLSGVFKDKRLDYFEKITRNVLTLGRIGQISQEETKQIFEVPVE